MEVLYEETFYGCRSLTSISFEKGSKLHTIVGRNREIIGEYGAFENCNNLTNIDATACVSLTTFGDYVFYNNSSLSLFLLGATTPPTLGNYTFPYNYSHFSILKVPDESVDTYKGSRWNNYFSTISGFSD